MIEVEVLGARSARGGPPAAEVRRLCVTAAAAVGVRDGHLAIEYVDAATIARLNREHRGKHEPTDVLSFPIDGADLAGRSLAGTSLARTGLVRTDLIGTDLTGTGLAEADLAEVDLAEVDRIRAGTSRVAPRELGDVIICPEHTVDLREAIVHGVLHLVGMDHETDDGQMLALQAELLGCNGS